MAFPKGGERDVWSKMVVEPSIRGLCYFQKTGDDGRFSYGLVIGRIMHTPPQMSISLSPETVTTLDYMTKGTL